MESSRPERRFPAPWTVAKEGEDAFAVKDANGVRVALVSYWDEVQRYRFTHGHLSSEEARKIAKAIARIPEFMARRRGFDVRGGGYRYRKSHPYHVALEESYHRAHWFDIDAICKFNNIPFKATGEKVKGNGLWIVFEFAWQMEAIMFWDRFKGRWLKGEDFHFPERPPALPEMKTPKAWEKTKSRDLR